MGLPNVWAICATCGRHTCMERSLRLFINQDYAGDHTLLIYQNSSVPQELDIKEELPKNKHVQLINNSHDLTTRKHYENLGAIYNDALSFIDNKCEIITHWDDDDVFLPNHISEGIKGYFRAETESKIAYKPERSWYRHWRGVELIGNNLEPSIFVDQSHIKKYGYSLTTSDQHMPWFRALLEKSLMLIDPDGVPTLIYNWGDQHIPTFKTSGDHGNPNNFTNYRDFSKEHGDKILTPWNNELVKEYYDSVKSVKNGVV